MKKLAILLIIVVLLTGCKSKEKKLTCSFLDSKDFGTVSNKTIYTFNSSGESLKQVDIEIVYEYTKNYMNILSATNQALETKINKEDLCSSYNIHRGINCKVDILDNKVTIKVTGTKNDYNGDYFKGDYKSLKEAYETLNYQCS